MKETYKIFVYGSLRKGEYNFDRFVEIYGKDSIKVVDTNITLFGYRLYSLGPYPGLKPANEEDTKSFVIGDILEVSQQVFNSITAMELGAGYYIEVKEIKDHPCVIYLYNGTTNERNFVKEGDWIDYQNK